MQPCLCSKCSKCRLKCPCKECRWGRWGKWAAQRKARLPQPGAQILGPGGALPGGVPNLNAPGVAMPPTAGMPIQSKEPENGRRLFRRKFEGAYADELPNPATDFWMPTLIAILLPTLRFAPLIDYRLPLTKKRLLPVADHPHVQFHSVRSDDSSRVRAFICLPAKPPPPRLFGQEKSEFELDRARWCRHSVRLPGWERTCRSQFALGRLPNK